MVYGTYDRRHHLRCACRVAVSKTATMDVDEVRGQPEADLRVQKLTYDDDGRRAWVVLDLASGSVHWRAERFLAPLAEGTQRTYAYHLVDHLLLGFI